jgi:hypothetical protein
MPITNNLGQTKVGVRTGVLAQQVSYLLDTYSGAAAAYSLRKLRTAYTGNAIRVRRSSDNTSQDIGFKADGTLDTTTLLSFVGAGNGFVSIWYDQSGNGRNSTQSTILYQPRIVNSGVVEVFNSKPSLKFAYNSTVNALNFTVPLQDTSTLISTHVDSTQNSGASIVKTLIGAASVDLYLDSATGYNLSKLREGSNGINYGIPSTGLEANNSLRFNYTKSSTTELIFATNNQATFNVFKNSTQLGTTKVGQNRTSSFITDYQIGASQDGNGVNLRYYTGNMFEVIIYATNQLTNRTGIESNINTHYSIY